MKKKLLLFVCILLVSKLLSAQQYAQFGTRSLFDSFENPAIKAFTLDSSGKYASNFLLPNFGINAANRGGATDVIRRLATDGKLNTTDLPIGNGAMNTLYQNSNVYLATFRIFSSHKYNQEIGFAWQVRSDANIDYTNETLAILDSYKRFAQVPYSDVFNNDGYQQSYHQFSVSLRENWDKRLAFGVKLSLLSGIAYNSLKIDDSYIYADPFNDRLDIGLNGRYEASFIRKDEVDRNTFIPNFRNPGAAISLGTTYQSRSGFFLMANVKDLGFIRWSKRSHIAQFNTLKSIYDVSTKPNSEIKEEITDIANEIDVESRFHTFTNAKADFMVSKTFSFYKPALIVSKNLFYPGGDVAFVNTFSHNSFSASITPAYNLNQIFMVGVQAMYKTPNFEFFLGSDNINKSIDLSKTINNTDGAVGTGYNGGSFYMGLGIKFGKTVNHPMNLSTMPGVNGEKTHKGFFRSIYQFFKK